MYDRVTLDQLRAFVTVVEQGSFSAAARKLRRVQSAISTSMANLEAQLAVRVWDRSTKIARLTPEGQAVLAAARRVLAEVDGLHRLTDGMVGGLEAHVSLCLDALFPLPALIDTCTAFAREFPQVALRIDTQVMSAVSARVLSGEATLGVVSPLGLSPGLERHALATIHMVPVVRPDHPLALHRGRIPGELFASAVQIVLSERSESVEGRASGVADQAVLSPRTWRVADLHTKHMMLCAGLGWGNLPEQLVRDDLRTNRLVVIHPEAWGDEEHMLHLTAVYRSDTKLGPAHRWMLDKLALLCARDAGQPAGRVEPKTPGRRAGAEVARGKTKSRPRTTRQKRGRAR
ncbi:MAG: lysR [Myxococcaceae bacterium]|nr:lysR [Myxococcaceae bacterium]